MYLKIAVDAHKGRWKIFEGVRSIDYQMMDSWTWEEYQEHVRNCLFITGPYTKEAWDSLCGEENGKIYFIGAVVDFGDGWKDCVYWCTVAYLLNDDGKTIEAISPPAG